MSKAKRIKRIVRVCRLIGHSWIVTEWREERMRTIGSSTTPHLFANRMMCQRCGCTKDSALSVEVDP